MKTSKLTLALAAAAALITTLPSCGRDHSPVPTGVIHSQGLKGTSSGGGGFKDEDANFILHRAQKELVQVFSIMSDSFFQFLPRESAPSDGYRKYMVELIKNIKSTPNTRTYRYNKELALDYHQDQNGHFVLFARKGYYDKMDAVPASMLSEAQLAPYLLETKLLILHEVAHAFDLGTTEKSDSDADIFAILMLNAQFDDMLVCSQKYKNVPDVWPLKTPADSQTANGPGYFHDKKNIRFSQDSRIFFVLNQASGKGAYYSPWESAEKPITASGNVSFHIDPYIIEKFNKIADHKSYPVKDDGTILPNQYLPSLHLREKLEPQEYTPWSNSPFVNLESEAFDWQSSSVSQSGAVNFSTSMAYEPIDYWTIPWMINPAEKPTQADEERYHKNSETYKLQVQQTLSVGLPDSTTGASKGNLAFSYNLTPILKDKDDNYVTNPNGRVIKMSGSFQLDCFQPPILYFVDTYAIKGQKFSSLSAMIQFLKTEVDDDPHTDQNNTFIFDHTIRSYLSLMSQY